MYFKKYKKNRTSTSNNKDASNNQAMRMNGMIARVPYTLMYRTCWPLPNIVYIGPE
jgi:hypothetical protein